MMNRRRFLQVLSGAFLADALAAAAQPAAKIPRIGVLHSIPASATFEAFRKGLRELGYVEGQHLHLEYRWAEGGGEGLYALAAQLSQDGFDVILAISSGAALAAKRATNSTPIVFCAVGEDPIRSEIVSSLARPGANVTGTVTLIVELEAKRLELLKDAVPGLSRVAVVWNPSAHPGAAMQNVEAAARRLNIQIMRVEWKGPRAIDNVFQLASRERAGGVLALTNPEIMRARKEIAQAALKFRLPTAGMEAGFAEAGNLLQYGPDREESCRRAASYVDRILKGTRPGDLPVEQATKFELVINLKTARALGVMIPPSVLLRADRVIE